MMPHSTAASATATSGASIDGAALARRRRNIAARLA